MTVSYPEASAAVSASSSVFILSMTAGSIMFLMTITPVWQPVMHADAGRSKQRAEQRGTSRHQDS